ncbi:hypothetical protein HWD31_gp22 [Pantoea phage vB_PagM_SSEM1]|uniref:Uncharacterized protein n=1 Tax=Pantoea phage vB_PagM_SSEM1 TaxID=2721760 RepID=A0A6H0D9Z0_9CAUD|nr:hypothetical protein HWD31_gp22 [Pantoea phage vB_PagM_SSEM1]QIS79313.1 hypothetical protein SSEM1_gp22 [Pantoea phage vB_PagM_SSEM1]
MPEYKPKNCQLLVNGQLMKPADLSLLEAKILPPIPVKPNCLTPREWYSLMYECETKSPTMREIRQQPELQNLEYPVHQMTQVQLRLALVQDELQITLLESKAITVPSNPIGVKLRQIVSISEELARLRLHVQDYVTMPVIVDLPFPSENVGEKLISLVAYSMELLNTQLLRYKYPMTEPGLVRLLDSIRHSNEGRLANQIN